MPFIHGLSLGGGSRGLHIVAASPPLSKGRPPRRRDSLTVHRIFVKCRVITLPSGTHSCTARLPHPFKEFGNVIRCGGGLCNPHPSRKAISIQSKPIGYKLTNWLVCLSHFGQGKNSQENPVAEVLFAGPGGRCCSKLRMSDLVQVAEPL